MAGIYIHIPFCRKACHYCNFHFSTTHHRIDELVNALNKELILRKNYLSQPISTIYFGGGTPSLLEQKHLTEIFNTIHSNYSVTDDAEISFECNPDDITHEKLTLWAALRINRLSIGVQSFFEEDLQWMNRAHNATQALHCIQAAQDKGFNNLTIDLIYGTPGLTDEKWLRNIHTAVHLKIPHLSCYALTVEPETALHKLIEKGKKQNVNSEQQSNQFDMLMHELNIAGFDHYEISNFAKPGFYSKHNSNYWNGSEYLGIGPSAHSFNTQSRQWNIANNALYIQNLAKNEIPFEIEYLTPVQKANEYIMTSLRTHTGLNTVKLKSIVPEMDLKALQNTCSRYIDQQMMMQVNGTYILTNKGKHYADGIASNLFID